MKVTPVTPSPAAQQVAQQAPATDKRAAAIAAFEAASRPATPPPQAQEHPVANPNSISPEEASVVRPATAKPDETLDNSTPTEDTQPATPEKDPEVVRQFQEIARQERILRAKAQKQQLELQQQKAALEAQKAALDAKAAEYEQGYISKDRLKQDALSVLEENGLTYEELTQQLLNPEPKNPRLERELQALRDEIKALRGGLDETKQAAVQSQTDAYQAAIRQIEQDTKSLVSKDPETYEAISKTNSIKDVVELIEQTYQKDGILMSVEEAALEVENYLIEEGINQVSRIDKIKKRLAAEAARTAAPTPVTQEDTKANNAETPTMKTLTNNVSSTRKLSPRERALLAFKGELNKG
jgi:chromosome segregation ATPase